MNKINRPVTNLNLLLDMLASKDSTTREKARINLIKLGKPAVSSLTILLQNTKEDHLRWEAAKTLGEIGDKRAIPSLVKALEDSSHDVAWLAAESLANYKKEAWPALLRMLINKKPDSVLLRKGAHHVFVNQKENGFNDLLESLRTSLKSSAAPELTVIAAHEILKRMRIKNTDK